jgi:hypothetical protein
VAHACNLRYLGVRDQEDHNLKPAWTNSLRGLVSTKKNQTHTKQGWQSDSSGRVRGGGGVREGVGGGEGGRNDPNIVCTYE